jgi:hypothetical protein
MPTAVCRQVPVTSVVYGLGVRLGRDSLSPRSFWWSRFPERLPFWSCFSGSVLLLPCAVSSPPRNRRHLGRTRQRTPRCGSEPAIRECWSC